MHGAENGLQAFADPAPCLLLHQLLLPACLVVMMIMVTAWMDGGQQWNRSVQEVPHTLADFEKVKLTPNQQIRLGESMLT